MESRCLLELEALVELWHPQVDEKPVEGYTTLVLEESVCFNLFTTRQIQETLWVSRPFQANRLRPVVVEDIRLTCLNVAGCYLCCLPMDDAGDLGRPFWIDEYVLDVQIAVPDAWFAQLGIKRG